MSCVNPPEQIQNLPHAGKWARDTETVPVQHRGSVGDRPQPQPDHGDLGNNLRMVTARGIVQTVVRTMQLVTFVHCQKIR